MIRNTSMERISVVMPCHNAVSFVEEAVASVLQQTYPDVELLIVDDGSIDGSAEVLRRLAAADASRLRVLWQKRQGPYMARNLGLQAATGSFIAFLDADDWWDEHFLAKLAARLREDPEAQIAYCGWQNVGLPGGRGAPFVPPDYEAEGKLERLLRAASPWPIHAALVRKDAIDAIHGFKTYLPTCMDYDLWLRLALEHRIVRVPEVLAFYRHHDKGQIVSKQWRQAANTWSVKKVFIREHPEHVAELGASKVRALLDGALLRRGYDNYWRRDLVSARRIFRLALRAGGWGIRDLRYLLPALLPERWYLRLIGLAERGG